MTERSRFWGGTATGDATVAPYDAETEFAQVLMSIAEANEIPIDRSIVFLDELNKLVVTGAASPLAVGTGRALVYGNWYENDASVSIAIPTPAVSTRIDRIVLRKSWAAQTVRITRIAGTEGAGVPAITQIAGTTWDMPIAQVSITTGAVITITDERDFLNRVRGVRAYHSVVQTCTTGLYTPVNFNVERFDTDGYHDNVTNNMRFTVPPSLGGLYAFGASGWWEVDAGTDERRLAIYLNGAAVIDALCESIIQAHGATLAVKHETQGIWVLAPGDYLEVRASQNSGTDLNLNAGGANDTRMQEFWMYRIGQLNA